MIRLRAFLHAHRGLAALLLAAALCIKAVVPAGYMIGKADMVLSVSICADAGGAGLTRQISIPVKHGGDGGQQPPAGDCAYTGLSMAALGAVDGLLLAVGLAFILALGFAPQAAAPLAMAARLRPPLRGPPRAA